MKRLLCVLALVLPSFSVYAQSAVITSLPSPTCAKPAFTVPVGSSITLVWTAPTKNADGTAITGTVTTNLYSVSGPNPVLAPNGAGLIGTSTVRANLSAGTPCYALTAVVNGVESATLSNTASVSVVVPTTPLPPAGLTCTLVVPAGGGAVTGNCTASP
jgi:hypothetical protein